MYRFTTAILLLISGWLLTAANADTQTAALPLEEPAETRTEDYRLGPGDVINVTVDVNTHSGTGRIVGRVY